MTIQELLRAHRIEIATAGEHHHARPGWLAIRQCPFCNSSNYHLGYNIAKGFFSCWKCRGHGVISTLVRLGVPFAEASLFYRGRISTLEAEQIDPRGVLHEPPGRGKLLKIHREYLRGRGFDPEDIQSLWELEGFGHLAGAFSWRIYIPIHYHGRRVSWTTRSIGNEGRRYMSASASQEILNHKHVLYGADMARYAVVAVEGPTDAWNVGPGAVALFGLSFTPAQAQLLSIFPSRTICFDSTPDAQRRAQELASQLALFPGNTTIIELDADDPGSASRKEITLLRKTSKLD